MKITFKTIVIVVLCVLLAYAFVTHSLKNKTADEVKTEEIIVEDVTTDEVSETDEIEPEDAVVEDIITDEVEESIVDNDVITEKSEPKDEIVEDVITEEPEPKDEIIEETIVKDITAEEVKPEEEVVEEKIVEVVEPKQAVVKPTKTVKKAEPVKIKKKIEHVKAVEEPKEKAMDLSPSEANLETKPDEAIENDGKIKFTMNPFPKVESADGEYSFQPIGRIHYDVAFFDDDVADHPDGGDITSLRIGAKGKLTSDFNYKFEVDFSDDEPAFKDVYLEYVGLDNMSIKAGNFKQSFTFENITSGNETTFIDSALPVSAFSIGETLGLNAGIWGDNWTFNAGVFNDDSWAKDARDEEWSFASRATFAPILDEEKFLHIGASASYRNPDSQKDTFRFKTRAENDLAKLYSVDTGDISNANSATLYGVELAGAYKSLFAQAEYIMADVDTDTASDPSFSGYYAQIGYLLTGETRGYDNKKGLFARVKPKNPVSLENGGFGAFEVAARYSSVDLTDDGVLGGEMDDVTVGVNWYVNDYIRFMANYIMVDVDADGVTPNDSPDILLFRGQLDF